MSSIADFKELISILKNMAWGNVAVYHVPEPFSVDTEEQIGP